MSRLVMITKGLFVRSVFSVSSIISVWGVVTVREDTNFWLLLNISGLLFVEAAFTFSRKRMGEWKWFCPSVFLYLLASLPSIWLIELRLLQDRLEYSQLVGKSCASSEEVHSNLTALQGIRIHMKFEVPIKLTSYAWSVALQQLLIFVLILGRWMLPKGKLTRDQLSQLLLVYIGIAADILEFSTEGLKLPEVRCNRERTIYILCIWNWSLLQFAIGLTVTKARKPRVAGLGLAQETKHSLNPVAACCETEVWGIMATIIMQDGPFLAMRLYLLVEVKAVNHMMVFFTCKNTLIILLQLYRLAVIYLERPNRAHHFMQATYARYRGHTFRRSSGSHGDPEVQLAKKKANNMKQTPSRQRLLVTPTDPHFHEQVEPLMKDKDGEKGPRPRYMQKKSPSEKGSRRSSDKIVRSPSEKIGQTPSDKGSRRKKVNNDARPTMGPKQTPIPQQSGKGKPDRVDSVKQAPLERRASNKPKNTDDRSKSNFQEPLTDKPRAARPSSLAGSRQKNERQPSPSFGRSPDRVNFSLPDNVNENKPYRKKDSKEGKPRSPEAMPMNFLDPSRYRKHPAPAVRLASLEDDW